MAAAESSDAFSPTRMARAAAVAAIVAAMSARPDAARASCSTTAMRLSMCSPKVARLSVIALLSHAASAEGGGSAAPPPDADDPENRPPAANMSPKNFPAPATGPDEPANVAARVPGDAAIGRLSFSRSRSLLLERARIRRRRRLRRCAIRCRGCGGRRPNPRRRRRPGRRRRNEDTRLRRIRNGPCRRLSRLRLRRT